MTLIPTLLGQLRDVRQGFWIPDVTAASTAQTIAGWAFDKPCINSQWVPVALVVVGLLSVRGLVSGGRNARLAGLLAFVPWFGAVSYSMFTGRSVVLDRCFVFAYIGLVSLLGVVLDGLPKGWMKVSLAGTVITFQLIGIVDLFDGLPRRPTAWRQMTEDLAGRVRGNDRFVVPDYREVNRLRVYAEQSGMAWIDVKAPFQGGVAGHSVHRASLDDDELTSNVAEAFPDDPRRVWWVTAHPLPVSYFPPGWTVSDQRRFSDPTSALAVYLLERTFEEPP